MENIDLVAALSRWIHFMAGVMWIGLLYYFNFVQVAALKNAGADGTPPTAPPPSTPTSTR